MQKVVLTIAYAMVVVGGAVMTTAVGHQEAGLVCVSVMEVGKDAK